MNESDVTLDGQSRFGLDGKTLRFGGRIVSRTRSSKIELCRLHLTRYAQIYALSFTMNVSYQHDL